MGIRKSLGVLIEPHSDLTDPKLRRTARIHASISVVMVFFAVALGMGLLPWLLFRPHFDGLVFWAALLAIGPFLLAYIWSRQGKLTAAATVLSVTATSALLISSIGQTAIVFFAISGVIISSATLPPRHTAMLALLAAVGTCLLFFDPNVDMAILPYAIIGNTGLSILLYLGGLYVADQEAQRRAVDGQMRRMIEDAPDAILKLAFEGDVVLCNPAAETLFGRSVVVLQNSSVEELGLCTKDDLDQVVERGFLLQHGRLSRPDGSERHFEAHLSPDSEGISASVRDTTDQSLAWVREQALELALEESRRLETVGRLAGGVAHDFNNQLTIIYSACSLLDTGPPEEFVELIETACDHAAALTRQLLRFARESPREVSTFSSEQLMEELRPMLETLVRDSIELDLQLSPGGYVRLDPTQLRQVLINVVANASDAMPDGGAVRIRSQQYAMDELKHDAAVKGPAGLLTITVSDEGCGMSEETADRVFEPFYTTKRVGEGTGLGLATAYGIVTQADGAIAVESAVGEGTRIIVSLPMYDEETLDAPEAVSSTKMVPSLLGLRVLVVDDLAAVGTTTKAVLRAAGMDADFAHGPVEALRMVEEEERKFDLLISDVVMPGLSGPRLLVQLRKSLPEIKVLFVSGYTGNEDLGGELLLRKPYSSKELTKKLLELVGSLAAPQAARS